MIDIRRLKIFPVCAILCITLFLVSCESEKIPVDSRLSDLPEEALFSEHVIPVLETSCSTAKCHDGSVPPDLTTKNAYLILTTGGYLNLSNPEASFLYEKIETGTMKSYASDYDRAVILNWISNGAKNN